MLSGSNCIALRVAARVAPLAALLVLAFGHADGAKAQEPTDAQKSAIKANCRSDFMANCSGVPRGGPEALQCLKKNVASLSPGCQQAVNAIAGAPASPPAAAKAAPAAPETSGSPQPAVPATSATSTQGATPPPPAPAPANVTAAPTPSQAKPAAAPAAPAASTKRAATPSVAPPVAPAAMPPVRVVRPVQILFLVRNACRSEYHAYCSDVDLGGGRVIGCLEANAASLSPLCRSALADLGR